MLLQPTCSMDNSSKINHARRVLLASAQFLQKFLPLANAHNCDFITNDLWRGMLPTKIADQLLLLSPDQLKEIVIAEERMCKINCCVDQPGENTLLLDITDSTEALRQLFPDKRTKFDKSQSVAWDSDYDLDKFLSAIEHHVKLLKDIVTSTAQFSSSFLAENSFQNRVIPAPHIAHGMTEKKSHEIQVMTEMCASIVKSQDIAQVVDIGSGRGYLGCQLSLLHGLKVIGIDSSLSNTQSAEKRTSRVQKYWPGLMRKAKKNVQNPTTSESNVVQSNILSTKEVCLTCCAEDKKLGGVTSIVNGVPSQTEPVKLEGVTSIVNNGAPSQTELVNSSAFPKKCDATNRFADPGMSLTLSLDNRVQISNEGGTASNTTDCDNCRQLQSTSTDKCLSMNSSTPTNKEELYVPITCYVTPKTDLWQLICDHYHTHDYSSKSALNTLLLTGLHTCGDLASSLLRLFVANANVQTVCNVGCCYHHIEEEFVCSPFKSEDEMTCDFGFPLSQTLKATRFRLGRNARMLACQSTDRLAQHRKLADISLYWRALLQVILRDLTGELRDDWQVGKIAAKCNDFKAYVRRALGKLKLPYELSDEDIQGYEDKYASYEQKLQAFFQLKTVLAPCIELFILVDRLCFLLEQLCDSVFSVLTKKRNVCVQLPSNRTVPETPAL